jgi:phage repressor protein C with HTH and peptisase S24 domain
VKIPLKREVADRVRLGVARFSRKWDLLDPGRRATAFKLLVLCELLGGRKKAAEVAAMADNTLDNYRYGKQDPTFRTLEVMAERAEIGSRYLGLEWRLEEDDLILDFPQNMTSASYADEFASGGMTERASEAYLHGVDEIAPAPDHRYALLDDHWVSLGLQPNAIATHLAQGDSMSPTIADRTPVFIDTKDCDLADGGIYAIRTQNGLIIRRVQHLASGGIHLLADNQAAYPPEKLGKRQMVALDIVGRVRSAAVAC